MCSLLRSPCGFPRGSSGVSGVVADVSFHCFCRDCSFLISPGVFSLDVHKGLRWGSSRSVPWVLHVICFAFITGVLSLAFGLCKLQVVRSLFITTYISEFFRATSAGHHCCLTVDMCLLVCAMLKTHICLIQHLRFIVRRSTHIVSICFGWCLAVDDTPCPIRVLRSHIDDLISNLAFPNRSRNAGGVTHSVWE